MNRFNEGIGGDMNKNQIPNNNEKIVDAWKEMMAKNNVDAYVSVSSYTKGYTVFIVFKSTDDNKDKLLSFARSLKKLYPNKVIEFVKENEFKIKKDDFPIEIESDNITKEKKLKPEPEPEPEPVIPKEISLKAIEVQPQLLEYNPESIKREMFKYFENNNIIIEKNETYGYRITINNKYSGDSRKRKIIEYLDNLKCKYRTFDNKIFTNLIPKKEI